MIRGREATLPCTLIGLLIGGVLSTEISVHSLYPHPSLPSLHNLEPYCFFPGQYAGVETLKQTDRHFMALCPLCLGYAPARKTGSQALCPADREWVDGKPATPKNAATI